MRFLLYPFALLYDVVTSVRNRLYDLGYKPSATFDIPLISIGNLSVGGTGKTPMVEYMVRTLRNQHNVATLSRGYGRKTKGFRVVSGQDTAETVGDEPLQVYRKFDGKIPVFVGEERALAISLLIHDKPEVEVIILDDAFQHRKVRPSFQVLLTEFDRPFFQDFLLPVGRLRESREGADRADAIIVTKSPDHVSDDELLEFEKAVRQYADKPVFFTTIRYGLPVAIEASQAFHDKVVLVSGVANEKPFDSYARTHFQVVRHIVFNDHHIYSKKEVSEIAAFARKENAVVLTTEKDAAKLSQPEFIAALQDVPGFYLPIETVFIKGGEEFDEMILNIIPRTAS
ncbi:MAG TPA: tetraacyldisaccharide 4'-kinase [Chryseosolibacter sp.]|nr:tetraacyldisaccharide 4'-kinase [Chryseosolibacter sp.]